MMPIEKLDCIGKDELCKFLFDDVHRIELKINRPFKQDDHFIKSKEMCWQTSFEAFKKNYRNLREDFINEINKFMNENIGSRLESIKYITRESGIYGNTFHLIARIVPIGSFTPEQPKNAP